MTTQRALSKELITEIEYAFNQNRQELKNIINQIIESTRQEERERIIHLLYNEFWEGMPGVQSPEDLLKKIISNLEAYQSKGGEK